MEERRELNWDPRRSDWETATDRQMGWVWVQFDCCKRPTNRVEIPTGQRMLHRIQQRLNKENKQRDRRRRDRRTHIDKRYFENHDTTFDLRICKIDCCSGIRQSSQLKSTNSMKIFQTKAM